MPYNASLIFDRITTNISQIWPTVAGYEELAGEYLEPIRNAELFWINKRFFIPVCSVKSPVELQQVMRHYKRSLRIRIIHQMTGFKSYILPIAFFRFLSSLIYCFKLQDSYHVFWLKITIWLWRIHSSHSHSPRERALWFIAVGAERRENRPPPSK